ncbi:MAG: hypoxanthine phosphoribosyltransferase [Actinobacteria bacterium]|nr:MAG: hypoxanthine phosphoribosyltransferase [Actinomycetota bacterium]TML79316.1 MAG: hypoxanthine phosphoribosyltransferase [Actinomycetota bacterium]
MPDETVGLLLTAEQIATRVAELGAEISRDYAGKTPILIGVLKGSLVFMADLARAITTPINVDFMSISSYGDGTNSGVVRILKDLDESITGHDVILVEDIIDTGLTLTYLLATLSARRPASLEVCGLLDKSVRRIVEVPIRYKGFDIPDEFVIGYGLDHEGRYRNLRAVLGVRDMAALRDPDLVARALESAGA